MRVLVVAPSFPSLNQPWIDTYLESLLREGIEFCIFSGLQQPGNYQDKVDRLGLLSRVRHYSGARLNWLPYLVWRLLRRPFRGWRDLRLCATEVSAGETTGLRWIRTVLRSVYLLGLIRDAGHFDLFHGHFEDSSFEFLVAARILCVPMVMTFHGLPPKGVAQPLSSRRPYLYNHLERVFVNTRYARSAVVALGCPLDLVRVLPQGIPSEEFPFVAKSPPPEGVPLRLLTVGRFHRDKGHGRALVAAKRLQDQCVDFYWSFIGVGPVEEIDRLRRITTRLGLEGRVAFEIAAPPEVLKARLAVSDLFVLPSLDQGPASHVETQGVVVQEAQASGCIPIVTRVGGVPECVVDGENAIVIRPGSSRAIVGAVMGLIERKSEWPKMAHAGRLHVTERFSAGVIGREMARQLREVAGVSRQDSVCPSPIT